MQLIVHNIFKKTENTEKSLCTEKKTKKKYRFTVISSPSDGKAVKKKAGEKKVIVEISVVEIKKINKSVLVNK